MVGIDEDEDLSWGFGMIGFLYLYGFESLSFLLSSVLWNESSIFRLSLRILTSDTLLSHAPFRLLNI